ncbi:hypothetical protein LUZ63_007281 [Rhynchospora breviuscula]|uniref:Reverse transcriptase zinc-binding domain-containing protein n=1 Tax=Rhynchospora breviuscula TaxID=2022672 RepID=A0A9Q0CRD8_9POAL|nr:hypothetical protein LUZ63_007281 [Rhynchospora breviuscula]
MIRELFGTTNLQLVATHGHISSGLKDILRNMEFFSASIVTDANHSSTWRWTNHGFFSSNSAYKVLADTGVWCPYQARLWKIKAPPKVKVFLWLLLQDRLLTQDNLVVRGWPAIQSYTTCHLEVMETVVHLFIQCPFARSIWDLIQVHYNFSVLSFSSSIVDFWLQNRAIIGKQWDIIWAAVSWALWKERNARIFSSDISNRHLLLREIVACLDIWKHNA